NALNYYLKANNILHNLCETYKNNTEYATGITIIFLKLGETCENLDFPEKAINFYIMYKQKSLELFEQNLGSIVNAQNVLNSFNKLIVYYYSYYQTDLQEKEFNEFSELTEKLKQKHPSLKVDKNIVFFRSLTE
ncbi:MAG: hypothetical protein U9Q83_02590, partial [Bacteroidota bacterium]|nr:hypothetical protein [Bacteroidota bacterium]